MSYGIEELPSFDEELRRMNELGEWMMAKSKDPIHIKKNHEGELRKETGTKPGKDIPESKLKKAEDSKSPAERKRATFAENERKWKKK